MELQERGKRKVKTGRVLSNKMNKTVVVAIERTLRHPKYGKVIKRKKKIYAHNDLKPLEVGELVTVVETRPLSKLKRWRVINAE